MAEGEWEAYNTAHVMPKAVQGIWASRLHGWSFVVTFGRLVRLVGADLGEVKASSDGAFECMGEQIRKAERAAVQLAGALEKLGEHYCGKCASSLPFLMGEGDAETAWTLAKSPAPKP